MSDDATGSGLGGASSTPARGGSTGRGVAGGVDASAGAARLPNGGASLLGRLYAGTLPLHPHTDELTGGVIDYLRTQWGTDHLAAADPHPAYLTTSEGDLRYLPIDYVPPASGLSQADADLRYVNTAGDTMTGVLHNSASIVAPTLIASGPPGTHRTLSFGQYGVTNRWWVSADSTPETGSDAGSNFSISRFSDAGAGTLALTLSRATGAATFGGAVTVTSSTWPSAALDCALLGVPGALSLAAGLVAAPNGRIATNGNLELDPAANTVHASRTGVLLGSVSQPWINLHTDAATVAGKPVAVSPTAGNALTWDATGFWAPAGGGGGGLPTTGGTLTGPITAQGAAVDSGGALRVVSPDSTPGADKRLYGAGSAAFAPGGTQAGNGWEYGLRFAPSAATKLVGVRWFRVTTGQPAPPSVRLWDTTTSAVVWSKTTVAEWASSTLGWLEHRLAGGTEPNLVAGRAYILSYSATSGTANQTGQPTYLPVGDTGAGGVTVSANIYNGAAAGLYPNTTGTTAFGIDGAFNAAGVGSTPASTGAVRLPNAANGWLAWRNAANTADLTLTMDASDGLALAVGAGALTTSATAGAASALPGVPAGYLTVTINGTARKLAYWA